MQVAQEISRFCRDEDLVARWGGEEFALLLPNCEREAARVICERIRQAITEIDSTAIAPSIALSISIGVTTYQSADTFDQLISRADSALYTAKEKGRNCTQLI